LDEGTDLETQIGVWLRRRDLKLVTAESCTGGLLGHRITNVPGSSDYYLGGIVSYAYEAKECLLGVRHETLTRFGAVSQETALEMAAGAREALSDKFRQDQMVGVSVTVIAGPGGGLPNKPVGTVWIGLSAPELHQAWVFHFQGSRVENKTQSAEQALLILLDYLQGKITP
jgi:PncC family amidohydrolase